MRRILPVTALVAVFCFGAVVLYGLTRTPARIDPALQESNTVVLKGRIIYVEVVDTEESREKGLSGGKGLLKTKGCSLSSRKTGNTRSG